MLRVIPVTLLVATILTVAVQAQRSAPTFQGRTGLGAYSGFSGPHSISSGFFSHTGVANGGFFPQRGVTNGAFPNRFHHRRHNGILFPYFLPAYDSFWYEPSETDEAIEPPVVIEDRRDEQSIREKPLPQSKIIDIPGVATSTARKPLPQTIFILISGERLESRQFLLTASDLSIKVDRYHRTIPLGLLNLDATIAANRERGIHLRVPADRNEISLSF